MGVGRREGRVGGRGPHHGHLLFQLIQLPLFLLLLAASILCSGGGRRGLASVLKEEGRAEPLFPPDGREPRPWEWRQWGQWVRSSDAPVAEKGVRVEGTPGPSSANY